MRLPLIIGIIGLIEVTSYLQKVHGRVGGTAIAGLIGSFILAAGLGVARAATVHLWVQDGQAWRKGAAHFGLDYLIDPHSPDGGIAGASL